MSWFRRKRHPVEPTVALIGMRMVSREEWIERKQRDATLENGYAYVPIGGLWSGIAVDADGTKIYYETEEDARGYSYDESIIPDLLDQIEDTPGRH